MKKTTDKNIKAVIDRSLCINCGMCSDSCGAGAVAEYKKCEISCSRSCPLGIVPQTVAALINMGDVDGAERYISGRNPLPGITAEICDSSCMKSCVLPAAGRKAVNIRALERFAVEKGRDAGEHKRNRIIKKYSERIAVIGAGPAGLAAAARLTELGYSVTVFESEEKAGGAMTWGIPDFRLNRRTLENDLEKLLSEEIEIRYGLTVGNGRNGTVTMDDIKAEGFDAVLICVGKSYGSIPDVKGADGEGVYDGVTVMRALEKGIKDGIGQKTAVIGDGDFAADLARKLVRENTEVICAASERAEHLAMSEEQVEILKSEGVALMTEVMPKQIIREKDRVKALELVSVERTAAENGQVQVIPASGSEHNLFCDTVIFAFGRHSSIEDIISAETYPDGDVRTDERHRTNKDMVFACGDVTGRSCSVTGAAAEGIRAAEDIDEALRGRRLPDRSGEIYTENCGYEKYIKSLPPVEYQTERRITEGAVPPEPMEDIIPVLRSAGIEENMPVIMEPSYRCSERRKKIAIAGGGIAGITAAVSLAKEGYEPVIFEKASKIGGRYTLLSSDRRIDRDLLEDELAKVERAGIKVVTGAAVGIAPTVKQLKDRGYDAVLFAVGETGAARPDMKNAEADGVYDTVTAMSIIAAGGKPTGRAGESERAVVCGSDEMSVDAAVKLRETCAEVTLLMECSLGAAKLMGTAADRVLEAGVNIITGVKLREIEAENNRLTGVNMLISENRHIINIPCDLLVIGGLQRPDTEVIRKREPEIRVDKRGFIETDAMMASSVEGVFAIGDFRMSAPDSGRAAAAAVANYLKGVREAIPVELNGIRDVPENYEIAEGRRDEKNDIISGSAVYSGYQAFLESSRCAGCGCHGEIADKCIGCGICAEKCPAGAIELVEVN